MDLTLPRLRAEFRRRVPDSRFRMHLTALPVAVTVSAVAYRRAVRRHDPLDVAGIALLNLGTIIRLIGQDRLSRGRTTIRELPRRPRPTPPASPDGPGAES